MTARDPQSRPDAVEALEKWRDIRSRILSVHLLWRVRPREEPWLETLILDLASCDLLGRWFVQRARTHTSSLVTGLRRLVRK